MNNTAAMPSQVAGNLGSGQQCQGSQGCMQTSDHPPGGKQGPAQPPAAASLPPYLRFPSPSCTSYKLSSHPSHSGLFSFSSRLTLILIAPKLWLSKTSLKLGPSGEGRAMMSLNRLPGGPCSVLTTYARIFLFNPLPHEIGTNILRALWMRKLRCGKGW